MNTDDIKLELKQKQRSIIDLLRFIETRTDNNPNYSLLLGSGCSVTSNIRSGGHLIDEWRKEIYLDLIKYDEDSDYKGEYCVDEAINYLSKKGGSWYNKSNEYSSLFEKKYDLPRQRRMFVEKEVSDKTPSIGYAYLINLIKDTYFNTIFTTNFDDLINEAFYQFSEDRPITCAHDSSINSITVTSKRPKIIKLHGDYLFDDIKSTLRETESLEDNIRNKFIEFSKDYGLIVVGYGGHDRSIMDVLNYLLKHDDYYKHGIYWCLRKGDTIGEELRKLLWKDRVYFVEIEGFDELFSELHNSLFDGKLPIDTNFISSKSQDIVQKFIKNKYLKFTNSDIIKQDLKNLEMQNERNNLYDAIKDLRTDDDFGHDKLDNKEVKILIELANLSNQHHYDEMLDLIDDTVNKTTNKYFKIELYKKMVSAYKKLDENIKAMEIIDKLIEIDYHPTYFISKANLTTSFPDKIALIDKAIELDSYYEGFYNKKASLLIEKYNTIDEDELKYKEIIDLLNTSLDINPSNANNAFNIKFDFILEYNSQDVELKDIINKLEKQDPYSLVVLNMKYDLLENDEDKKDFIETVKDAKKRYFSENKLKYNILLLRVLDDINDKLQITNLLDSMNTNEIYKLNSVFLRTKAHLRLKKFDDLKGAIKLLKESIVQEKLPKTIIFLVDFLLYDNEVEEAKEVLAKYKSLLPKDDFLILEMSIYDKVGDYNLAYNKVKELQKFDIEKKDKYIAKLAYYLLHEEKYQDAKVLLKEYLERRNFSIRLEVEIINYEFACKMSGTTPHKKRLEKIKSKKNIDNLAKAAVFAIEDNNVEVFKALNLELEKNNIQKYEFQTWPIFKSISNEDNFKNLFN